MRSFSIPYEVTARQPDKFKRLSLEKFGCKIDLRLRILVHLELQGQASPCEHSWVELFLSVAFIVGAHTANATHIDSTTKLCSQGDARPCAEARKKCADSIK